MDVVSAHHVIDSTLKAAATLLNLLQLYFIVRHSTFQVTAYKCLLLLTCLSDLSVSIVVLIGQPVVMFADGYYLFICNGFFQPKDRLVGSLYLVAFVVTIHANLVFMPVQFLYRYRILAQREGSIHGGTLKLVALVTFVLVSNVAQAVIDFYMVHTPEGFNEIGLRGLRDNRWPYDAASPPLVWGSPVKSPAVYLHLITFSVISGGGYGVIIWCERQIFKRLRRMGEESTNDRTREMHREVHKALLSLAIAPLFTSVVPIWFFMISIITRTPSGPLSAFMSSAVTLITLVNPITTIFFVKSYRYALLSWFGITDRAIMPDRTVATGALSVAPTSDMGFDSATANTKTTVRPFGVTS